MKEVLQKKTLFVVIPLLIALLSVFVLSGPASSPDLHGSTLAALEEKQTTVLELSAASAAASAAITLIPGDVATPIADKLADLSSHFLLVLCAVFLEKYLLTILSPSYPTDTAIIFYPGAKVEGAAYLPLLDQLRRTGLTCILVEMPFRMAIFDINAAEDVMAQFPEIRHWYLAGHSMGGAMASQFAAGHRDQVDGLILLGAYLYGEYPSADTLTVYGSLNQSVEDKIDYTEHVVEIDGGNHAQFGSYGLQRGDPPAEITPQEQQARTVEAISDFLAQRQER